MVKFLNEKCRAFHILTFFQNWNANFKEWVNIGVINLIITYYVKVAKMTIEKIQRFVVQWSTNVVGTNEIKRWAKVMDSWKDREIKTIVLSSSHFTKCSCKTAIFRKQS